MNGPHMFLFIYLFLLCATSSPPFVTCRPLISAALAPALPHCNVMLTLGGGEITVLCDNQAAVEIINKGRSKFKFKLSFIVIPLHVGTYSGTKCHASQDHGAT